jgi:hypothetical protein
MGEENMLRQLYWCSVKQQLFLNPIYLSGDLRVDIIRALSVHIHN